MTTKTQLTLDDVKHIAKLSRLTLTDDEIIKFQKQLSSIVSYIDELKEVDTKGIEPTSQTTGLTNVMALDEINNSQVLGNAKALSGAKKSHDGYFVVPMVLENK